MAEEKIDLYQPNGLKEGEEIVKRSNPLVENGDDLQIDLKLKRRPQDYEVDSLFTVAKYDTAVVAKQMAKLLYQQNFSIFNPNNIKTIFYISHINCRIVFFYFLFLQ